MIDEILNSYGMCLMLLRRAVEDVDEAQMVAQPHGVVNHPAWTLGHLIFSAQAIGGEMGVAPWLGDGWGKPFGTGSTPQSDPSLYPSKEELLAALADAQRRLAERLKEIGEEGLSEPMPDVRYREVFPTLGHAVLHILTVHASLHVGQLQAWRRAMGLARASG